MCIPKQLLDLVPEPVARENRVIPIDARDSIVTLLSDINRATDVASMADLEFVLNTNVRFVHANSNAILKAINWGYRVR